MAHKNVHFYSNTNVTPTTVTPTTVTPRNVTPYQTVPPHVVPVPGIITTDCRHDSTATLTVLRGFISHKNCQVCSIMFLLGDY